MLRKEYFAILLLLIIAICAISTVNAEEIGEDSEIISEDNSIDEVKCDESTLNDASGEEKSVEKLSQDASTDVIEMEDEYPQEIVSKETEDDKKETLTSEENDKALTSEVNDNTLTSQNNEQEILTSTVKRNIRVSFYKQTGKYVDDKKVYIKIIDADTGKGIKTDTAQIEYYSDGSWEYLTYAITNENGIGYFKWEDTLESAGTFNIRFKMEDYYDSVLKKTVYVTSSNTAKTKVIVAPRKAILTAKKLTVPYKSKKNFQIKITYANNKKPVKDEHLKVTIYTGKKAKTITLITNSKGIATYKVSKLSKGKHKVVISLKYEDEVAAKKITTYITVGKASAQAVTIKASKLSTTYKSGKYFKAKVVNSKTKEAIEGAKVSLKVYTGKKAKTVTLTSNSKGIIKYSSSKLGVGNHKVILKVKGKAYKGKAKTSSIKVSKARFKITAPKATSYYKQSGKYTITVTNKASGKIVKGAKVVIKVYTGSKVKKYSAKTNAKGKVSISTKSLSKGKHKVVVTVAGNSRFKKASAQGLIKIIKKSKTTTTNGGSVSDSTGGTYVYRYYAGQVVNPKEDTTYSPPTYTQPTTPAGYTPPAYR